MEYINVKYFNQKLTLIGYDSSYTSMIFNHKFQTYGDFELVTCSYNKELHKIGNYIIINEDKRKCGIIKHIEVSDTDGLIATIRGYTVDFTYGQLITIPQSGQEHVIETGKASTAIRMLIFNQSSINGRGNNLMYFPSQYDEIGNNITIKSRYDNLFDVIIKACISGNIGIKTEIIEFTDGTRAFKLIPFQGVDRSSDTKTGEPYIFNRTNGNVVNRNYILNDSDYRNCAYVGGQGEGKDRKIIVVGGENINNDRYEIFVDARDINADADLKKRGYDKLSECAKIRSYEFETYADDFQTKYDIGDIVTVVDNELGVSENKVINEVRESIDSNGKYIELTLGKPMQTIGEKVNSMSGGSAGGGSTTSSGGSYSNAFGTIEACETAISAYAPNSKVGFKAGTNVILTVKNNDSTASAKDIVISAKDTTYNPATITSNGLMTSENVIKLDGIDTGANKTIVDSALSDASENPVMNKIIKAALDAHTRDTYNPHGVLIGQVGGIAALEKGIPNGVATLDSNGFVPSSQLPSYVDDIVEGYYGNGGTMTVPNWGFFRDSSLTDKMPDEAGKIYVDIYTNKTYRYTGGVDANAYVVISESLALGETFATAYRGDLGKEAYDHSKSAHAPSNAERNVISSITVNGQSNPADSNRNVDIYIPMKTSELTNDTVYTVVKSYDEWLRSDLILRKGENGYDSTNHIAKYGDGLNTWPNLPVQKAQLDTYSFSRIDVDSGFVDADLNGRGFSMNGADGITVEAVTDGSIGKILKVKNSKPRLIEGIKGSAESSYRTGYVNISPSNIGLGNVTNKSEGNLNVNSASKLTNSAKIEGSSFDGSYGLHKFGFCSTNAYTTDKYVYIANFVSTEIGSRVFVKFTNGNSTTNIRLGVSGTGYYYIKYKDNYITNANLINSGIVYELVYDGSYWQIVGTLTTDLEEVIATKLDAPEIGSTSAGNYIKYPNGMLEQWGSATVSYANGYVMQNSIVLPIAYKDTKFDIQVNRGSLGNSASVLDYVAFGTTPSSNTIGVGIQKKSGGISSSTTAIVNWRTIGFWK